MRGSNAVEIKTIIAVSLSKLARRDKATGVWRAFFCALVLIRNLEACIRPDDRAVYEEISEGVDYRGRKAGQSSDEALAEYQWLERRYPQIAQAIELAADIYDLTINKRFWLEYGFTSEDEWERATDTEAYILKGVAEVTRLGLCE